ncbi:MAG: hypothetical protein ABIR98_06325 [Usitatibacter sp.]
MKRTLIASIVAAAFAAPAMAQDAPVVIMHKHLVAADAPRADADAWQRWADDFSHEMRTSMGTLFAPRMSPAKVVKGAPYTAEMITESTQSLADGNTITRRKTGLVFRDGEGRTRQETSADGKAASIFITDPVEGKHYVLTPGSKRAISIPRVATSEGKHSNKQVVRVEGTEVRVEDGKVYLDGKEFGGPGDLEITSKSGKKIVVAGGKVTIDGIDGGELGRSGGPGRKVVVNRFDGPDGSHREEVRVHVVRGDEKLAPRPPTPPLPPTAPGAIAPLPPMPPLPGIQTMRFESTARLGKGTTTSLGSRDFDGVKADGKSTLWTIPAGEIGNKNPINITSESWYSPELKVTVQSRYSDPRTGETVYRLANIRRVEPAADLFQVPEEHKSKTRARG